MYMVKDPSGLRTRLSTIAVVWVVDTSIRHRVVQEGDGPEGTCWWLERRCWAGKVVIE